jgi:hypothetical protein
MARVDEGPARTQAATAGNRSIGGPRRRSTETKSALKTPS